MSNNPPDSLTITLPIPPTSVRPNGRSHWRKKAEAIRTMRFSATCAAIEQTPIVTPRWSRARVKYDWYHPTKRLLDRDNIIGSCKAYLDGIVSAGVLADDNGVSLDEVGRFVDRDNPRVVVTITPQESEDV